MSIARGPLRIVLLRSGGYDYAEIELQSPIHIVAGNNIGKTSLIAALQFLYIDDSRQMHFAHDWKKTRKHYFQTTGSFVLFECMTPTGLQVFGLRGLGPVQGFEYQRFAYSGPYDRDDYLDVREPRTWEEVSRRVVARDLRPMEPKHLRASLTGRGDAKGAPLGLVPLKRSGSYDSFRFLFRNLLRLSKIEQGQLKRLFIDISRPRLRRTEVDLRRDYGEIFRRVERDTQGVVALKEVAPAIADLVEHFAKRESLRRGLVAAWTLIETGLEAERARVSEEIARLEAKKQTLTDELDEAERKQAAVRDEAGKIATQRGKQQQIKDQLEALRDRTKSFVPELEEAIRARLRTQQDELIARLASASKADRKQVERELRSVRRKVEVDRKLVERFGDAVVTWLRARSGLSEDELGDVFGVLNPDLLGEVLGDGRASIHDEGAAVSLLRRTRDAFDAEGFRAHGVSVRRRAEDAASPLEGYEDVDSVRGRLVANEDRARDLAQTLADIADRDELERALDEARTAVREAETRLRDWESWEEQRADLDDLTIELEDLGRSLVELQTQQSDLQRQHTGLALREKENDAEIQALREGLRSHVSAVQKLKPPPPTWTGAAPDPDSPAEPLEEMVRTYRADANRQQQVAQRVDELFGDVEHKTGGRHLGGSEPETIERLQDELSALADREHSVQQLWTSLVDGMRSDFKALVEAVGEVHREVTRLTSALGRRQVSNLEAVSLSLVRQRDLIRKLEAVIEVEDAPLFAGPSGRSRAAREIQSWLENRPRIDLAELFDLRFKVVDARGEAKTFDSLAQIESDGTSATIKVLVHLELLRLMLADDTVAVPFFLDEVARLDDLNLGALIDHATGMGFVPVVASPKPADIVKTLYFLRPAPGGLVLDETSRLRLPSEQQDGG